MNPHDAISFEQYISYASNDEFWIPIKSDQEKEKFCLLLEAVKDSLINGTKHEKGLALETLVNELYRRFPSSTKVKSDFKTSDNQIDHEVIFGNFGLPLFISEHIGKRFIGESKNHKDSISSREVEDLNGLMTARNAKFGVFTSYKSFSKGLNGCAWKNAEGKRKKLALLSQHQRIIIGLSYQDFCKLIFEEGNLLTIFEEKRDLLIDELNNDNDNETDQKSYLLTILADLELNDIITSQESEKFKEKIQNLTSQE